MACGSLEIEILNSVWELANTENNNDISIQDIVDKLSEHGLERAYTTIKTVMDRLVAKSVLVRYKSGKKFFYNAVIDKEEMAANSVKEVIENFFNGSSTDLIHFIEKKYDLLSK